MPSPYSSVPLKVYAFLDTAEESYDARAKGIYRPPKYISYFLRIERYPARMTVSANSALLELG